MPDSDAGAEHGSREAEKQQSERDTPQKIEIEKGNGGNILRLCVVPEFYDARKSRKC